MMASVPQRRRVVLKETEAVLAARKGIQEDRRARERELQEKLQRSLREHGEESWIGRVERLEARKASREEGAKREREAEKRLLRDEVLKDVLPRLPKREMPFRSSSLDYYRQLAAGPQLTDDEERRLAAQRAARKEVKPVKVRIDKSKIPWWKAQEVKPNPDWNKDEKVELDEEGKPILKPRDMRGTVARMRRGREKVGRYPGWDDSLTVEENDARLLEMFEDRIIDEDDSWKDLVRTDPIPETMADQPGLVSMATVIKENLTALGLKEELHRVIYVFNYNKDYEGSLVEAVNFFTDRVNRRPIGEHITGLLLYYDRIAVNMIEGGQIQILTYLKELTDEGCFLRLRTGRTRVFATQPHCGPRLFPKGHCNVTTEAPPDPAGALLPPNQDGAEEETAEQVEEEEGETLKELNEHEEREFKAMERRMVDIGAKLRFLWTFLNSTAKSQELPEDRSLRIPSWMTAQIPSVRDLEYVLESRLFETMEDYVDNLFKVADVVECFEEELPPPPCMVPTNVLHPKEGEDEAGRWVDPDKILPPRPGPVFRPRGYPTQEEV